MNIKLLILYGASNLVSKENGGDWRLGNKK